MSEVAVAQRRSEPATVEQHPASDSGALMALIERVARDPSVDIEKMDRLLKMQERIIAGNAEEAFNDAMTAAQAEMEPIAADSNNPQTRSKYASYAALDTAVRPIYTKHGFALSYNSGKADEPGNVRVECYVTRGRHTRTYWADMPADGKGAKGGDVMTKTHATGSAFSYGQRYLLGMIFNLAVTGKREDDGNGASAKPKAMISETQVGALRELIKQAGTTEEEFCRVGEIDAIEELLAKNFANAKSWLTERINARKNRVDPKGQFDAMERAR